MPGRCVAISKVQSESCTGEGMQLRRGRNPRGIVLIAELAQQERRAHVWQCPRCQPENVNDAKDPTWGAPLAAAGRLRETLAGAFSHHMQLEEVGWGSTGSPLSPNPRPALREEPIPHSIRATGQNPALSPPQPCWRPFSPLRTSPEGQTRTLCFIHWKPRFPVLEPGGHRV